MQPFNLLREIITVDRPALLNAVNAARPFAITIHGTIVSAPFDTHITIYEGTPTPPAAALAPARPLEIAALLGRDYRVVEDGERVLIKAGGAWQTILHNNLPRADYDDTSGDGIAEFTDTELEAIGWHATEFDITYRDLVERIEADCDGTLLCIESDDQFSGLGFITDHACARASAKQHCRTTIATLMQEDPHLKAGDLTDDEMEALTFFGLKS